MEKTLKRYFVLWDGFKKYGKEMGLGAPGF